MDIKIVNDEACPSCGAYWGHPDPSLDFPNRVKVDHSFKCYNPECAVDYYDPTTERVEFYDPYREGTYTNTFESVSTDGLWLSEDEQYMKEQYLDKERERITEAVQKQISEHGLQVIVHNADGTVTDESIPPD